MSEADKDLIKHLRSAHSQYEEAMDDGVDPLAGLDSLEEFHEWLHRFQHPVHE